MLVETFTVGMLSANCYVASCPNTKEAIVIDPGLDFPSEAKPSITEPSKETKKFFKKSSLPMKDKRVVVTGGSGFIGSHLVEQLLEQGAKVAVTTRYGNLTMKNERLREELAAHQGDSSGPANCGALDAVAKFNPQAVFHCC